MRSTIIKEIEATKKRGVQLGWSFANNLKELDELKKNKIFNADMEILDIQSNSRLLEVGAGRGLPSLIFSQKHKDSNFVITDINRDTISGIGFCKTISKELNLKNSFVVCHYGKLPFKDASFNVVYGRSCLHHAVDAGKVMKECARVSKNTIVMLGEATRGVLITEQFALRKKKDPIELGVNEHSYTYFEYKKIFQNANLSFKAFFPKVEYFSCVLSKLPKFMLNILNYILKVHLLILGHPYKLFTYYGMSFKGEKLGPGKE